ncbi:MAG: heme NO-binding domain-containing protein, partial [Candidatus Acidiferrales bacterium]
FAFWRCGISPPSPLGGLACGACRWRRASRSSSFRIFVACGDMVETVLLWGAPVVGFGAVQQYPNFFQNHKSTRPFLLTLNDIIHPEVRKLYPGADVPVFDFDNSSEDVLLMTYRSHKKLCALAHGFIEGASAYYGQVVHFEQTKCMLKGNSECVFRISFD